MGELWVVRAGTIPYDEARRAQAHLATARRRGAIADLLILLEHPPVYTKGRRSTPAELPMGEGWYRAQGIDVTATDRGGRVTYHGPGQLVAYPIISLRELDRPDDVGAFVRVLERAIVEALAGWGVEAGTVAGLTGVWVGEQPPPVGEARKIGSIGIHVHRGVTTHGLAVNVNNDLQPFEWIVPCGIEACRMTSLARERGAEQDLAGFGADLADRLAGLLGRTVIERRWDEVGALALEPA